MITTTAVHRAARVAAWVAMGMQVTVLVGALLLLLPSAVTTWIGWKGARRLRHDPAGAGYWLGFAMLLSVVPLAVGLFVGDPGLVLVSGLSTAGFAVAWRAAERVSADQRRAWAAAQVAEALERHAAAQREVGGGGA